eukprot:6660391-Pyramimonas_sp.AAC.1
MEATAVSRAVGVRAVIEQGAGTDTGDGRNRPDGPGFRSRAELRGCLTCRRSRQTAILHPIRGQRRCLPHAQ